MATTALGCGRDKPRHESGSRQRFELLQDSCQSGTEDTFAPHPLPALKTLDLNAEYFEGAFQDRHNLATNVGLDVSRLTMFFLKSFLGLVTVLVYLLFP